MGVGLSKYEKYLKYVNNKIKDKQNYNFAK